jgi:hypothetical protein
MDVPASWIIMVAVLGQTLAKLLPELKLKGQRGRPKSMVKNPKDDEVLDAIENVMAKLNLDFESILPTGIEVGKEFDLLMKDCDPTTHRKRLKDLRAARKLEPPTMASELKRGGWRRGGWEK